VLFPFKHPNKMGGTEEMTGYQDDVIPPGVDFRAAKPALRPIQESVRKMLIEEAGVEDPRVTRMSREIKLEIDKSGVFNKFVGQELDDKTAERIRAQAQVTIAEALARRGE
jgi:hypothetical protein